MFLIEIQFRLLFRYYKIPEREKEREIYVKHFCMPPAILPIVKNMGVTSIIRVDQIVTSSASLENPGTKTGIMYGAIIKIIIENPTIIRETKRMTSLANLKAFSLFSFLKISTKIGHKSRR